MVQVKARGLITAYHFKHHPFDVVGWDGYLFPFSFNIGDFEPITGRVHQPPPVHQTFAGRNYVVCSFVPRKFDYHPLAIPAPYNHSNINSDEVIYYVAGNFMSRRGVEISSFTVHPAGHSARPHPGTVEASIGKEAPRSWRSWSTRSIRCADQAGGRARGRRLPVLVAAAQDGCGEAGSSPSEARRPSPTDPRGAHGTKRMDSAIAWSSVLMSWGVSGKYWATITNRFPSTFITHTSQMLFGPCA